MMRVFKISDGTSWVARPDEGGANAGWEGILFESDPQQVARLVYRPAGWLARATDDELAAALSEGEAVRARWGA